MRRILLTIVSALFLTACFEESDLDIKTDMPESVNKDTQMVFICTGETAYSYHLFRDCRGLEACEGDVITIFKTEIAKYERNHACGYCSKR